MESKFKHWSANKLAIYLEQKTGIKLSGKQTWTILKKKEVCLPLECEKRSSSLMKIEPRQESKRLETILFKEKEFISTLIAHVPLGIISTDESGKILLINPAFERICGYSSSELVGKTPPHPYWNPADLSLINHEFELAMSGKKSSVELWFTRKNGERFLARLHPITILEKNGNLVYLSTLEDITEHQLAEQKIREQAALLDIATDAIFVRDLDNKILFWNRSAEKLYGWKAEEAIGKNANQLLYKEALPKYPEIHKNIMEKGEWQGELHQLSKDGKEIIVESRWTLVRSEENKPKSILIVNTDITEKKQLEKQFLRAQRIQSLGTLASGIAHDLNNVLAPILTSAQLLQMKIFDDRSQRLLKTLEANTKRAAAVVKQVLEFARGVTGERTLLHIRDLITEIEKIITATFPESITLYTDIAPNLWDVYGDATQLHQMLINLIVNARDAMLDGGTLKICAENVFIDAEYARVNIEASVGSYIRITVTDTGIGMSPEVLERIFEPFFTTKEVGQGTGLGLSTVMGILKSHGGFINVTSTVGKGTQFQVFLKAVEVIEKQQVQDIELPRGSGELILIVDDEALIRETTTTLLEAHNYKIITAKDGIEALAVYIRHKDIISAVLVDIMMPSMDGIITIRMLQKIKPEIKIIAFSGMLSHDSMNEATGVGVKAFLLKPYTASELLNTISGVLNAPNEV